MARKIIVGLDVDGVLADFLSLWVDSYETARIAQPNPEKIARVADLRFHDWDLDQHTEHHPEFHAALWETLSGENAHQHLDPYEDALEGVRALEAIEGVEVDCVTAPMQSSRTWTFERTKWLEEHFGIRHTRVHYMTNKARFSGDVLVDDKPSNVTAWEARHPDGIGVVWAQPYNVNYPGLRVAGWDALIRLVRRLAK